MRACIARPVVETTRRDRPSPLVWVIAGAAASPAIPVPIDVTVPATTIPPAVPTVPTVPAVPTPVAAIAIALSGVSVPQFWGSLVLLGVGWNFLFIGATALLTETYRPEERAKAQGANDMAIFVMMTISSLTSGMIVTSAGWERVNYAAAPMIAVVAILIAWLGLRQRAARAAA